MPRIGSDCAITSIVNNIYCLPKKESLTDEISLTVAAYHLWMIAVLLATLLLWQTPQTVAQGWGTPSPTYNNN